MSSTLALKIVEAVPAQRPSPPVQTGALPMFERTDHFIAGRWVDANGSETIDVISPSTEQLVGRVPVALPEEIDAAIAAAREAFDIGPWPRLSVSERAQYLRRLFAELDTRRDAVVRSQIDEMGAPYRFVVENFFGVAPFLERMIKDAERIQPGGFPCRSA
jgi:aldehyde dehydrogenase (NAD+)